MVTSSARPQHKVNAALATDRLVCVRRIRGSEKHKLVVSESHVHGWSSRAGGFPAYLFKCENTKNHVCDDAIAPHSSQSPHKPQLAVEMPAAIF